MAIGDEIRKSYASDAAVYNGAVQGRQIGGADAVMMYSALTNKKRARPSPINKTGVDTTVDINAAGYTTNKIDMGNSTHAMVGVELTSSTGSITVTLAKYDTAGVFCGFSADEYTFYPRGPWRTGGGSGKYPSIAIPFEVGDASYVYPVVVAMNDSSTDIYVTVL